MKFSSKHLSYLGLIFVILLWGIGPMLTLFFYKFYSPAIRVVFTDVVCIVALFFISFKHLKELNSAYLKVAIPTGLFMAVANVLQKVGLMYTTPTNYAFLENLSCVTVPLLLFLFIKKKPTVLTVSGALICLLSSFILARSGSDEGSASLKGDILCALAGIFYGVNIAGTGVYAKKLYAPLYLMVQMMVELVVSSVAATVFHFTGIETIKFSFDIGLLLLSGLAVFVSSTVCWIIRTNAMKHVDATVVAVMMPFSAVVTAIVSVILGTDTVSINLVLGAVLGLVAVILSSLGDKDPKEESKKS